MAARAVSGYGGLQKIETGGRVCEKTGMGHNKHAKFIFKDYAFDPHTGELALRYQFDDGPEFREVLTFPLPLPELSPARYQALDEAFRLLFLLAGVSYFKADVPPRLVCEAFPLSERCAAFCEGVYRNGLGEFAFCNQVSLDFEFEHEKVSQRTAQKLDLSKRQLVPVGGGKDSIVTIEACRKSGSELTLFALGGDALAQPISRTIAQSGLPHLHVRRRLSPTLMELNRQGALNGHVPITAILSAVAVVCAVLYDYGSVVLSNESSANAPNVVWHGREINHQYSKSLAFEKAFGELVRDTIATDLRYVSLLRPLSETAIAARFARLVEYHDVFRSCNTAFRQDESKRGTHWCCACPKCRFVFLALAPFMPKEKLISVFGRNLLDEEGQCEGFEALCGLGAIKPFECVGEIEESQALLTFLAGQEAWAGDKVVSALSGRIKPVTTVQALLDRYDANLLTAEEAKILDVVQ